MSFDDTDLLALLPRLRANARNFVNRQGVDDLVQDTIVRMMDARDRFVAGTNLQAWAYVVMRSVYLNQLRKRRCHNNAIFPVDDTIRIAPEAAIDLRKIVAGFDNLGAGQADAIRMTALEGFDYAETAAATGVSVGTIKSRVSRGREVLQRKFGGNL